MIIFLDLDGTGEEHAYTSSDVEDIVADLKARLRIALAELDSYKPRVIMDIGGTPTLLVDI